MVRWKTLVGPKMSALGRLVALHCFICLFHTLVKMSAPAEYTWSVGSACERREKAEYARTLLTVHILLRSNISEEFSSAGKIGAFLLAGKNRNISPDRKNTKYGNLGLWEKSKADAVSRSLWDDQDRPQWTSAPISTFTHTLSIFFKVFSDSVTRRLVCYTYSHPPQPGRT